MRLDEDNCYRAVQSRDARFDGRFFTAVLTTGIYCRPVCPARTPLRKNVRFFVCAAAAQEAGFRPCRRCRPEAAPGTPSWAGTSSTVTRALRFIEEGALDEAGVESLAAKLGVGERHLRRLFDQHLGTSPHSVAAARRTHFARALLESTSLPVAQIAHASGFRSLRQFNAVARAVFGRTPTALRSERSVRAERSERTTPQGQGTLRLAFRPPLAWEALLDFLAKRATPGVEQVETRRYRRTVAGPRGAGLVEASLSRDGRALELRLQGVEAGQLLDVVRRARRLFDLDADPLAISAVLGASPLLATSVRARPGLRVPGAWDRFETLVRAVLGQQVSVAAATTLCGRLVQRFGTPVRLAGAEASEKQSLTHLFPTPELLAQNDLSVIGLPRRRAESLRLLSAAIAQDPSLLEPGPVLEALTQRLCALPGIGPWTAHYVAMRAFGEPDAFPSGDLGLRRAAANASASRLEALSEAWRPWRAYAVMHLWSGLPTSRPSQEVRRAPRAVAS